MIRRDTTEVFRINPKNHAKSLTSIDSRAHQKYFIVRELRNLGERETQRNIELIWLKGRLSPDFKTIADFRKDNGGAIRKTCTQFVALCRQLELFVHSTLVVDGRKFKDPAMLAGVSCVWWQLAALPN